MVAMLRAEGGTWNAARVRELIGSGKLPTETVERTARFIGDKPALWAVSDEEFLAAARDVDPGCATALATPAGLDFLHRMSRAVATKRLALWAGDIFGRR